MIFLGDPWSFEDFAPIQCVNIVFEMKLKWMGKNCNLLRLNSKILL